MRVEVKAFDLRAQINDIQRVDLPCGSTHDQPEFWGDDERVFLPTVQTLQLIRAEPSRESIGQRLVEAMLKVAYKAQGRLDGVSGPRDPPILAN